MTAKAKRGMEIYKTLPPEFNIYPVLTYDRSGCPVVDFEALADWMDAQRERDT